MKLAMHTFIVALPTVGLLGMGCGSEDSGEKAPSTGGVVTTGGVASGGQLPGSGGGTGGSQTTGGVMPTGGVSTTGGVATGGLSPTGGVSNGGQATGGTDNGIVIPEASNPNERVFIARDEGHSRLHYIDLGTPTNNWSVDIPVGRELQLVGDNLVMIGTENGWEERSIIDGSVTSSNDSFSGTIAARRLRNGNTLLVGTNWQGGSGTVLVEVDDSGTEHSRVAYPEFSYARLVRPTPTGTYLVASDTTIFEGNASGSVVWRATVQDSAEPHAWKALRLGNGETVVATGYEASLQFFDSGQQFLRRLKGGGETNPHFYCDFQILPNGNYIVTNWQGHGTDHGNDGHQIVELDASGNTVWSWQQDASFVSSLQASILLSGLNLGRLHVEDTTGVLVPVE